MLAFHAVISAYGFWLPNDPRGSWSSFVASWELLQAGGKATHVHHTRSVAHRPHDRALRLATKQRLDCKPVAFTGEQARAVARGISATAESAGYPIYALAVMATHLHAVIGTTQRDPARIIGHLKRGATDALIAEGNHPFATDEGIAQSCWSKRAWKVFLSNATAVARAIHYVEQNPIKDGLRPQRWPCVRPWHM